MSEAAGKVWRVRYHSNDALYSAYMSFEKDGGIFIPTPNPGNMGSSVFMMVELPGSTQIYPASGRISWINYVRKKGFGVQLAGDEDSRALRTAIENILGGMLNSATPTLTM